MFDGDIEALVLKAELSADGPWQLASLNATSHSGHVATAKVSLRHTDGRVVTTETTGDGPVDAAFKAVEDATGIVVQLRKFEVRSVSDGRGRAR